MTRPFRKLAVDFLLDLVGNPAENVWRQMSLNVLRNQGPIAYERPLIPGYPETRGEEILWGGQGLGAEIDETHRELEQKQKAKKGKRVAKWIKKLSQATEDNSETWEYEEGGRQQYWPDRNPDIEAPEYSAKRERDTRTGRSIAWEQVGEDFYRDSEMAEPAFLNQDNYNTSTTHIYDQ